MTRARAAQPAFAAPERFRYRAVDRAGKVVAGAVEADSRQLAMIELEKLALMPIEVGEDVPSRPTSPKLFSSKPGREDVTGATRDLAMLLAGGLNLDRALLVMSESGDRPALSAMLREVASGLAAGRSFAEALSAHPQAFPAAYVKMVEVAEAHGKLAETLALIARERTRSENLRRRIGSALAYPAFLLVAATAVLVLVLTSVVPEFERALAGLRSDAGRQADMIFALSWTLRDNAAGLAAAAILALTAVLVGMRSQSARSLFFQMLATVPGIRSVVAYERTTVICSNLSILLASGVDISSALRLIRGLMRDRAAAERLDRAVRGVRQGEGVSDTMRETGVLPAYAAHILNVGEKSGELPASLARISTVYEDKLDRSLTRLTGIVGPAVLVAVSLMIAWIIVSVMTALLSMNDLLLAKEHSHAWASSA